MRYDQWSLGVEGLSEGFMGKERCKLENCMESNTTVSYRFI